MLENRPSTPQAEPAPLFFEPGASWYWVLFGPAAALAMLYVQHANGLGLQPLLPTLFLVMVSGMLAVQVKAARIHTSVELTERTLRQGTETIGVDEIVLVYPEPDRSAETKEKWQEARALGDLNGVPRRRTGVGLRLTGRRSVQAWARNHRGLRAALTELVPPHPEAPDDPASLDLFGPDGDDGAGSPW